MIVGGHSIIYSKDAEADRAFLRDVLKFPNVDVGHGWLIFGLPPAEVAVHPSSRNDLHEFYLMCADVDAFVSAMSARGVKCEAVQDMGWGRLTQVRLPGGGKLGVYQPRHGRPKAMEVARPRAAARRPRPAAASRTRKTARKATRRTKTKAKGSRRR